MPGSGTTAARFLSPLGAREGGLGCLPPGGTTPLPPAPPPARWGAGLNIPPPAVDGPRRTVLGFVATRRVVEIILTIILGIGGGLLLFGSNFGLNMVHTQLT